MSDLDEKIQESKKSAALLYQLIHDIIKESEIYTQDLIGVLETIKLEFMFEALQDVDEEDESGND